MRSKQSSVAAQLIQLRAEIRHNRLEVFLTGISSLFGWSDVSFISIVYSYVLKL